MAVPQQRNQKKSRGRRRAGHTVASRRRRLLLDPAVEERPPSFEDWLDEIEYPGDWLEEYPNMPTMEDRLASLHREGITLPSRGLLDRYDEDEDEDDFIDIGNDSDDLDYFE